MTGVPQSVSDWRLGLGPDVPDWVLSHLSETFQGLPGIRALIVHGSLGRGEFTVLDRGASSVVLSDVEVVVVPRSGRKSAAVRRAVSDRLAVLTAARPSPDPFFSVDFSVCGSSCLRTLPRWFITFEKRHGSRVFGDPSSVELLPTVTAANIDLRESNETIVWRLLNLLHHMPTGLLDGRRLGEQGARVWAYICYRNALDFTTWLCPHLGIMTAGFQGRLEALRGADEWDRVAESFGPGLDDLLGTALTAKLSLDQAPAEAPYADVVALLTRAFEAITRPDAPGAELLYSHRRRPRAPFLTATSPRRLASLARRWSERQGGGPTGMSVLGKALVEAHRAVRAGELDAAGLGRAVQDFYAGTRGFLSDVERRVESWQRLQQWWEGHYA